MKDLNQANPVDRNKDKWYKKIELAKLEKPDTWYTFRLIGGVFSAGSHFIPTLTKQGKETAFSIECVNWCQDKERPILDNNCLPCANGYKLSVYYYINVIDRQIQAQVKESVSPIRALRLSPTALTSVLKLNKLNIVNGVPYLVTDPEFGCDVHLEYVDKGQYKEWHTNKGDRAPLTNIEKNYDLYEFDKLYELPEYEDTLATFRRLNLFKNNDTDVNVSVQVPDSLNTQMPDLSSESVTTSVETQTESDTDDVVDVVDVEATPLNGPPPQKREASIHEETQATDQISAKVHANTHVTETTVTNTPPLTSAVDVPDCFPTKEGMSFKGQLECMKCNSRDACIEATNKFNK